MKSSLLLEVTERNPVDPSIWIVIAVFAVVCLVFGRIWWQETHKNKNKSSK